MLKAAHVQVADLLSAQQLQEMSERYAQVRKTANLTPRLGEIGTAELATTQAKQLAEAGSLPHRQRELFKHQQLAERIGNEARSIAQGLRQKQLPGAESFDQEARRAFHTGRHVHLQRQQLYRESHATGARDQQRQADVQEAMRSGKEPTAAHKANAPAGLKQALDRQQRRASDRSAGTAHGCAGHQSMADRTCAGRGELAGGTPCRNRARTGAGC